MMEVCPRDEPYPWITLNPEKPDSKALSNPSNIFTLATAQSSPLWHTSTSNNCGNAVAIKLANRKNGLNTTQKTAIPEWYGDRMDPEMAVDKLLDYD